MDTAGGGAHWLSRPKACIRLSSVVRLMLRLRAAATLLPPWRVSASSSMARNAVSMALNAGAASAVVGDVTDGAALGGSSHLRPQIRVVPWPAVRQQGAQRGRGEPDGRGQLGEYGLDQSGDFVVAKSQRQHLQTGGRRVH
jgi:hypothetical protein